MRTTTLTRHYVTNPATGQEVQVSGPLPADESDIVVIEHDGQSYRTLVWAVQDDDPFGLWEWEGGESDPAAWYNGCFKDFRNGYDRYNGEGGQDGRDAFHAAMVELVGSEHVFLVEVYSHGLERFSRVAAGVNYPDRQWDVCASCVLAVPPDVTNPAEWADGVLESYTSYVCGDVWGIVTVDVPIHYDYDATPELECESVWGVIGSEHAEEMVRNGGY